MSEVLCQFSIDRLGYNKKRGVSNYRIWKYLILLKHNAGFIFIVNKYLTSFMSLDKEHYLVSDTYTKRRVVNHKDSASDLSLSRNIFLSLRSGCIIYQILCF